MKLHATHAILDMHTTEHSPSMLKGKAKLPDVCVRVCVYGVRERERERE